VKTAHALIGSDESEEEDVEEELPPDVLDFAF